MEDGGAHGGHCAELMGGGIEERVDSMENPAVGMEGLREGSMGNRNGQDGDGDSVDGLVPQRNHTRRE